MHILNIERTISLFSFLESETIATRKWVINYLRKQGISFPESPGNIRLALADLLPSIGLTESDIKLLANKMSAAWRQNKRRQNKDVEPLSVDLDKKVSKRLSEMSKGHTKAEVVTMLIENTYPNFFVNKIKLKNEEKEIRDIKRQNAALKVKLNEKTDATLSPQLDLRDNIELKDNIAKLYDLIFSANKEAKKVDDKLLLEATKIYYASFNK